MSLCTSEDQHMTSNFKSPIFQLQGCVHAVFAGFFVLLTHIFKFFLNVVVGGGLDPGFEAGSMVLRVCSRGLVC